VAVTAEWAPDYTSQERAALIDVWSQRGGAPAMLTDFVMAQVKAGLVRLPESLRGVGERVLA